MSSYDVRCSLESHQDPSNTCLVILQRIVASSPVLAERSEFAAASNLGTIDVLATRLWLDRHIVLKNPSNVLAGFEPTTGATLFDLNSLQVLNQHISNRVTGSNQIILDP